MEAKEHRGKSLLYLAIHPDDYVPSRDYPLIILLHGFGANMYDLAGLAPALARTGYVYACPNAPVALDIGGGMVGFGWTSPMAFADPDANHRAETLLEAFFAEVLDAYRVPAGRALLAGFSQGASLAYQAGLTRPGTFAGVVALSGGITDADTMANRLPSDRSQSVFIAHGEMDPIAPVESARHARHLLEGWGYRPVYREYPMAHEIAEEVLADLRTWLRRVLPPLGGGLVLP